MNEVPLQITSKAILVLSHVQLLELHHTENIERGRTETIFRSRLYQGQKKSLLICGDIHDANSIKRASIQGTVNRGVKTVGIGFVWNWVDLLRRTFLHLSYLHMCMPLWYQGKIEFIDLFADIVQMHHGENHIEPFIFFDFTLQHTDPHGGSSRLYQPKQ